MGTTLTAAEAIAALAPLVGAGGVSGIIIAIFAYLREVRKGRRGEPEMAGLGISAILADSESIRLLAAEMGRGSDAFEKNAAAVAALVLGFAEARPHVVKFLKDLVEEQSDSRKEIVEELRRIRHALEEHSPKPGRR